MIYTQCSKTTVQTQAAARRLSEILESSLHLITANLKSHGFLFVYELCVASVHYSIRDCYVQISCVYNFLLTGDVRDAW